MTTNANSSTNSLSLLVHGASKVGKSWLGDTTPSPRIIIDAEGGSRFTPSKKIIWNTLLEEPPIYDENSEWDTCIVHAHTFSTVRKVFDYLNQSSHPYKSVVLDSISEIQQRCVDDLVGINQMRIQDWGTLLRTVSDLVRRFRDLTTHPINPVQCVFFIAMTRENKGKYIPYMQGQIATTLPYYLDVIGYLYQEKLDTGETVRKMLVSPHTMFEAGERVGGKLGEVVINPDIQSMIDTIYNS